MYTYIYIEENVMYWITLRNNKPRAFRPWSIILRIHHPSCFSWNWAIIHCHRPLVPSFPVGLSLGYPSWLGRQWCFLWACQSVRDHGQVLHLRHKHSHAATHPWLAPATASATVSLKVQLWLTLRTFSFSGRLASFSLGAASWHVAKLCECEPRNSFI